MRERRARVRRVPAPAARSASASGDSTPCGARPRRPHRGRRRGGSAIVGGGACGAVDRFDRLEPDACVIAIVIVIAGDRHCTPRGPLACAASIRTNRSAAIAALIVIASCSVYGLLDARQSCGDLHFFWGPKAIHFYRDGGVTARLSAGPEHSRMNPGYPLLLPLIHAGRTTGRGSSRGGRRCLPRRSSSSAASRSSRDASRATIAARC